MVKPIYEAKFMDVAGKHLSNLGTVLDIMALATDKMEDTPTADALADAVHLAAEHLKAATTELAKWRASCRAEHCMVQAWAIETRKEVH